MTVEILKVIGIIEMVILITAELAVITPIIVDMWRDERKRRQQKHRKAKKMEE